jgi:hypothetical protein
MNVKCPGEWMVAPFTFTFIELCLKPETGANGNQNRER